MLNSLFSPPIFEGDDNKTRIARNLNGLILSNIPVLILFYVVRAVLGSELFSGGNLILAILIIVISIAWVLMKSGHIQLAASIHIAAIWLASTLLALSGSGVRGSGFTSYFVVMLVASLLLGWRAALGIAFISILSGIGMAYAETIGAINYVPDSPYSVMMEETVLLIFGATFVYLIINSLQQETQKARAAAFNLEKSNRELLSLKDTLQARVSERTYELEQANQRNEKRVSLFQAVAQVARAITSVREIEELLPSIAALINQRFGFYHVGIFLIDDAKEYAVLSATNSEGGKQMLEHGHKLRIGEIGIVGYVAASGNPRIALDTGTDAVFFNNPFLPNTRSEMALPLLAGNQTIGVLDVQSMEPNAFSQDDINILTTLADQAATAIQNASLFRDTQAALTESQILFSNYIQQAWKTASESDTQIGYRYAGTGLTSIEQPMNTPEINEAVEKGQTVISANGTQGLTLVVPIKLRGETIGVFHVNPPAGKEWRADDVEVMEAISSRVALALENATLVDETQRRASKERIIGEISNKISSVVNIDNIVETAARELSRTLPGAEVAIQLQNSAERP